MLSIQQVGSEILNDKPGKLYIFCGAEYGIKYKYIEHLKAFYGQYAESESAYDVISSFAVKKLIPLKPMLYIIRYDDDFLTKIGNITDKMITNIIGTVVLVYEAAKCATKCDKALPDHTVSFDKIHPAYIKKYLMKDYPAIPEAIIDTVINLHPDYMSAYNVCRSLDKVPEYIQDHPSTILTDIKSIFGRKATEAGSHFRYAVASRNVAHCYKLIDEYSDDCSSFFYTMLSCFIDLEKQLVNQKSSGDLKKYINQWDASSIYWMFMHTYNELERSRSLSKYDVYNGLIYLVSLLQYNPIPAIGVI